MTNEEKAREIAKEKSQSYGFGLNCDSSLECYNSALKSELDSNMAWLRGGCHILREHLPTTEEPTEEVEVEGAEGE